MMFSIFIICSRGIKPNETNDESANGLKINKPVGVFSLDKKTIMLTTKEKVINTTVPEIEPPICLKVVAVKTDKAVKVT